ncbi:MAG: hypothetical protein P2A85_21195 [Microcoleus anatoxicus]|uniref:hypothetical protein n=1 Tax=Microcoleus anatoxicus TaxID=2705319 RepID=UPI0036703942
MSRGSASLAACCLLTENLTGSQALPGNQCLEAPPRLLLANRKLEAEPLDLRSQAEPGNE